MGNWAGLGEGGGVAEKPPARSRPGGDRGSGVSLEHGPQPGPPPASRGGCPAARGVHASPHPGRCPPVPPPRPPACPLTSWGPPAGQAGARVPPSPAAPQGRPVPRPHRPRTPRAGPATGLFLGRGVAAVRRCQGAPRLAASASLSFQPAPGEQAARLDSARHGRSPGLRTGRGKAFARPPCLPGHGVSSTRGSWLPSLPDHRRGGHPRAAETPLRGTLPPGGHPALGSPHPCPGGRSAAGDVLS